MFTRGYPYESPLPIDMGVSINGGTPIAGWFILGKSHLEMDDLGLIPLMETPIIGNHKPSEMGVI